MTNGNEIIFKEDLISLTFLFALISVQIHAILVKSSPMHFALLFAPVSSVVVLPGQR
jgi:hypothetical protein